MKEIRDGTSNTILLVECDDQHAPIWTKPDDLPYDPNNPANGLGRMFGPGGFHATFCDGSVRLISPKVSAETLRRLFNKDDGKPLGTDF